MTTVRERVRAEMLAEIKAAARRQLVTEGANLSLRAIARELGMVSSAIYRYYRSRDELLTALIVDGYDNLADTVTSAESAVPREALAERFSCVARTIRGWALANPAEYALLYGSPVPGYVAPQETVAPVVRLTLVVMDILRDGVASGVLSGSAGPPLPAPLSAELTGILESLDRADVPLQLIAAGLNAWTGVFGLISFELFGHLRPITDYGPFFEHQVAELVDRLGLSPSASSRPRLQ